jgi:hypothetical protein
MTSTSALVLALVLIGSAAQGWFTGDFRALPRWLQLLNVLSTVLVVAMGVVAWLPVRSGVLGTITVAALSMGVASRALESRHRNRESEQTRTLH